MPQSPGTNNSIYKPDEAFGTYSDGSPYRYSVTNEDGSTTNYDNIYGKLSPNTRTTLSLEGNEYRNPSSAAYNDLQYGGSSQYGNQEAARQRGYADEALNRRAYDSQSGWMNQSRDLGMGLAGVFQQQAAGNPNSLAQQQLSNGFNASNQMARASAAGVQGGPLANVVARQTVADNIALNQQQRNIQSADLMASERMAAYGQLGGLGAAMRQNDAAWNNSSYDNQLANKSQNLETAKARENLGFTNTQAGMQGQQNAVQTAGNFYKSALGGQTDLDRRQLDRDSANQAGIFRAYEGGMGGLANVFTASQKDNKDDKP